MGAATLRRGEKVILLPKTLPSVSGADHNRALTDLRREMGLEVLKAKQEGGYTQEDLDDAVAAAVDELSIKVDTNAAGIEEAIEEAKTDFASILREILDTQHASIDELVAGLGELSEPQQTALGAFRAVWTELGDDISGAIGDLNEPEPEEGDGGDSESEPDSTPEAAAEPPAEHPTQDMNADGAVSFLEGLETVEEVETMIAAENDGKGRKGVLKACAEHIAWLNEPD